MNSSDKGEILRRRSGEEDDDYFGGFLLGYQEMLLLGRGLYSVFSPYSHVWPVTLLWDLGKFLLRQDCA